MTDELAERCRFAIHVVAPDGRVQGGGRASLYILKIIGWRKFSTVFGYPPLVWIVGGCYWVVARHRHVFSHLFFRRG